VVGSESEKCAEIERHICPRTFVSETLHYKNPTKHVEIIITSSKWNLFSPWNSWKIAHL